MVVPKSTLLKGWKLFFQINSCYLPDENFIKIQMLVLYRKVRSKITKLRETPKVVHYQLNLVTVLREQSNHLLYGKKVANDSARGCTRNGQSAAKGPGNRIKVQRLLQVSCRIYTMEKGA